MKKLLVAALVIVLAVMSVQVVGNHYRYDFYEWALSFEADRANLSFKESDIKGEAFAFLEGPRVEGQESIIMLHGFGASKENWLRFAAHFTPDYHVIALDLAGHGANKHDMNRGYTVADQVEFVRGVAKALNIDRFHLVGNSMGGAISSYYAATYPEQVRSLVLISPAGVHDKPSKMDELLELGENPLVAKTESEFDALLDFVMETKPFIPSAIARVEAEKAVSRQEINEHIFSHLRQDLGRGLEKKLTKIKAPALIIWGDHDRAISVANIDKYADLIPSAQKLIIPDVGHLAMIEVPAISAQAMLEFISPR